jgi:RNA recognition motif-containing protein
MTMLAEETSTQELPKPVQLSLREQHQQEQKERTLFCINIDAKTTEEILYELFLQAGPIENLIRKNDRNGKIFSLVTYKYIDSCDYAIKLFNGINLFNQPLKVQQSVPNGQVATPQTPTPQSHYQQSNFNQNRIRHQSMDSNLRGGSGSGMAGMMPNQPNQQMMPPKNLMSNPATFNPYPDMKNFQGNNNNINYNNNDGGGDGHQSRRNNSINNNYGRQDGNQMVRSHTYGGNSDRNGGNFNQRDYGNGNQRNGHNHDNRQQFNSNNKRQASRSPSSEKRRRR